jgi:asparagine synthase (glutamine-hydrolysing)
MCGIAVVVAQRGANIAGRAQNAIEILRHRGPDGNTIWLSPSGNVSVAHARLSTVGLSGVYHTLANEDGSIVAAVNGEFYEWKPLRSRLERDGHRFSTNIDSEVLVHLYEQCGVASLNALQGEFAFVLWDEKNQLLFAARDRFGTKPLYYSQSNEEMILASEVKALKSAGVALAWDEQGFSEQFIFQASLRGRTLFKGIQEIPPGHYLLKDNQDLKLRKYWDMNYPVAEQNQPGRSDESFSETLLELLDSAVQTRMESDVPVACYLSGGIDSNSILGLMARRAPNSITAFCASFDSPQYDEVPVAARAAAHCGCRLNKVAVTATSLAADFRKTVWHCESLITNANAVAKYALSRAVNQAGFRVVLSGEGSDELFAGYPHMVADAWRALAGTEREKLLNDLGISSECWDTILYPNGRVASSAVMRRLGYSPVSLEARHSLMGSLRGILPGLFDDVEMDDRLLDSFDATNQLNGRSPLNQSLYLQLKTSFPGVTLSSLGDRVELAHSVESRLPFLDHRVVNFARFLPCSQKVRRTVDKFVLRNALRSVVLTEVRERRKQPITAPPALWVPGSALGQLLQDTLRSHHLERIPFLNKKQLLHLLDGPPREIPIRDALEAPLTAIASACMLAETMSLS